MGAPNARPVGAGDVIGIGWLSAANRVFFTINGKLQEFVFEVKVPRKELAGLCPIIAGWPGLIITANFGQAEFSCKVCVLLTSPLRRCRCRCRCLRTYRQFIPVFHLLFILSALVCNCL